MEPGLTLPGMETSSYLSIWVAGFAHEIVRVVLR